MSFDYRRGKSLAEKLSVSAGERGVTVEISARQGSYAPPARSLVLEIHAQRSSPGSVEINGQPLPSQETRKGFESAPRGWIYDRDKNLLSIKVPDDGKPLTARTEK